MSIQIIDSREVLRTSETIRTDEKSFQHTHVSFHYRNPDYNPDAKLGTKESFKERANFKVSIKIDSIGYTKNLILQTQGGKNYLDVYEMFGSVTNNPISKEIKRLTRGVHEKVFRIYLSDDSDGTLEEVTCSIKDGSCFVTKKSY